MDFIGPPGIMVSVVDVDTLMYECDVLIDGLQCR